MIFVHLLAAEVVTEYTALGLFSLLVVAFISGLKWALPRFIAAQEQIGPTIARSIREMQEEHRAERIEQESRFREERTEWKAMLSKFSETLQQSAAATREALAEMHNERHPNSDWPRKFGGGPSAGMNPPRRAIEDGE